MWKARRLSDVLEIDVDADATGVHYPTSTPRGGGTVLARSRDAERTCELSLWEERYHAAGIKPDASYAQLVLDACMGGHNLAKATELQEVFRQQGITTELPADSARAR